MPFVKVSKVRRSTGRAPAVNRVSITISQPHAQLFLSADVFERLGAPSRVAFAVGTGRDAGQMIISPDPEGYSLRKPTPVAHQRRTQIRTSALGIKPGQTVVLLGHKFTPAGLLVAYRVEDVATRANGAHPVPQPENDPGFTRYAN